MAKRKLKSIRCYAIYDGRGMMTVDARLELYWHRRVAQKDILESGAVDHGARIVSGTFIPDETSN